MATKRVKVIVATTHPISAYGGIRLSDAAAEQFAAQLRTGTVPMTINHHSDRVIGASNIDAYTERREDGYLNVTIEFDVPEEDWGAVLEEIELGGTPGGFSFTTLEEISRPKNAVIEVAADAHHFTDDDILAMAASFANSYPTRTARAYQFSFIPDASIYITFAASVLAELPSDVLASVIIDACKSLVHPKRETIFNFSVRKHGDRLSAKLRIVAHDKEAFVEAIRYVPDSLRAALDADAAIDPPRPREGHPPQRKDS